MPAKQAGPLATSKIKRGSTDKEGIPSEPDKKKIKREKKDHHQKTHPQQMAGDNAAMSQESENELVKWEIDAGKELKKRQETLAKLEDRKKCLTAAYEARRRQIKLLTKGLYITPEYEEWVDRQMEEMAEYKDDLSKWQPKESNIDLKESKEEDTHDDSEDENIHKNSEEVYSEEGDL